MTISDVHGRSCLSASGSAAGGQSRAHAAEWSYAASRRRKWTPGRGPRGRRTIGPGLMDDRHRGPRTSMMVRWGGVQADRLVDVLNEEIIPRLDIEAAYPDVVFTRRNGTYWRGGCPMHGGCDPNFSVNTENLSWTCFSHCGHGSYLAFLNGGDPPGVNASSSSCRSSLSVSGSPSDRPAPRATANGWTEAHSSQPSPASLPKRSCDRWEPRQWPIYRPAGSTGAPRTWSSSGSASTRVDRCCVSCVHQAAS